MKRIVAVGAVLIVLLGACGDSGSSDSMSSTTELVNPSAEILATALFELATDGNTFEAGFRFSEYLIQNRLDPSSGCCAAAEPDGQELRMLTEAERVAIESSIDTLGPVKWIDDASDWRTDDLMPVIEGSVILGVGEPEIDGDTALVPISLWCGGLCGTWFTYRLEFIDGAWIVAGIDGAVAIS